MTSEQESEIRRITADATPARFTECSECHARVQRHLFHLGECYRVEFHCGRAAVRTENGRRWQYNLCPRQVPSVTCVRQGDAS